MTLSRGKQFETKFKEDWKKAFPNSFIYRLNDQISYYKNSTNPCDFICFNKPYLYLIETKTHEGNTIPFSAIPQYDYLLQFKDLEGVKCFVIVWFFNHNRVIAVPISTLEQMKKDNQKSININTLEKNNYNYIEIPSIKKRVFLDSDYSVLGEIDEDK